MAGSFCRLPGDRAGIFTASPAAKQNKTVKRGRYFSGFADVAGNLNVVDCKRNKGSQNSTYTPATGKNSDFQKIREEGNNSTSTRKEAAVNVFASSSSFSDAAASSNRENAPRGNNSTNHKSALYKKEKKPTQEASFSPLNGNSASFEPAQPVTPAPAPGSFPTRKKFRGSTQRPHPQHLQQQHFQQQHQQKRLFQEERRKQHTGTQPNKEQRSSSRRRDARREKQQHHHHRQHHGDQRLSQQQQQQQEKQHDMQLTDTDGRESSSMDERKKKRRRQRPSSSEESGKKTLSSFSPFSSALPGAPDAPAAAFSSSACRRVGGGGEKRSFEQIHKTGHSKHKQRRKGSNTQITSVCPESGLNGNHAASFSPTSNDSAIEEEEEKEKKSAATSSSGLTRFLSASGKKNRKQSKGGASHRSHCDQKTDASVVGAHGEECNTAVVASATRERKKPSLDACVFVRQVPESATEEDMKKTFSRFGDILYVKFVLNGQGERQGSAFVQFKQNAAALRAIHAASTTIPSVAAADCSSSNSRNSNSSSSSTLLLHSVNWRSNAATAITNTEPQQHQRAAGLSAFEAEALGLISEDCEGEPFTQYGANNNTTSTSTTTTTMAATRTAGARAASSVTGTSTTTSSGSTTTIATGTATASALVSASEGEGLFLRGSRLLVHKALSREESQKLQHEKFTSKRSSRERRHHLHLAFVGMISPDSAAYKQLPPVEQQRRLHAWQEKKAKLKNPNYSVNPKRLSVRNLPTSVTVNQLRQVITHFLIESPAFAACIDNGEIFKRPAAMRITTEEETEEARPEQFQTLPLWRQRRLAEKAVPKIHISRDKNRRTAVTAQQTLGLLQQERSKRSRGFAFVDCCHEKIAELLLSFLGSCSSNDFSLHMQRGLPLVRSLTPATAAASGVSDAHAEVPGIVHKKNRTLGEQTEKQEESTDERWIEDDREQDEMKSSSKRKSQRISPSWRQLMVEYALEDLRKVKIKLLQHQREREQQHQQQHTHENGEKGSSRVTAASSVRRLGGVVRKKKVYSRGKRQRERRRQAHLAALGGATGEPASSTRSAVAAQTRVRATTCTASAISLTDVLPQVADIPTNRRRKSVNTVYREQEHLDTVKRHEQSRKRRCKNAMVKVGKRDFEAEALRSWIRSLQGTSR